MRIAGGSARSIPPHVAFQFVGRRGLRSSHDVQRHGLVRVATEASDFDIEIARIERVTERRRWLRGTAIAEHALFQASQASLSACLRASFARSAAMRTELPKSVSRDLVLIAENALVQVRFTSR